MAVEGVRVEGDLGVQALEVPVLGDDERVDLQHAHVLAREGRVELGRDVLRLLGERAGEAERLGHQPAVVGHHAGRGVDGEGDDLVGRVVRHRLDVHAALRRDDEGDAAGRTVDQHREVELGLDVRAVLDVEAVHLLAGLAGLDRDEGAPEHLLGEGLDLGGRLGEAHAALLAGVRLLEPALAAPARVDLALHHPERAAELARRRLGLRRLEDRLAPRHGQAELLQDGLGLVFVDVHRRPFDGLTASGWVGARAGLRRAPG